MMNDITKHDMLLPEQLSSILATYVAFSYDEKIDIDNEIFDAVMGWYCVIQDPFCSRTDIRLYEVLCAIAEKLKEHDFYEE